MPSNYTENFNLSQWERTDKVLMEDFNADNAKIDAALKAEADVRAELTSKVSATLSRKGNCRIYFSSYIGNGASNLGTSKSYTFPGKPLLVMVGGGDRMIFALQGMVIGASVQNGELRGNSMSWSGNTVSWSGSTPESQLNVAGRSYNIMALIALD